jgi:outer membrane protein, heavy metal efflux system
MPLQMSTWIVLASLVFGVGLGWPGAGIADEAGPLRLADVLSEARERNPELGAARARADAMAAVPAQVSAYDDPTLSYEAWNVPESLRIDRADNNIFRLSQKIPFPGKRGLAGEIARREAARSSRQVGSVALDLEVAVKQAFYELWEAHARLAVFVREKDLVERFTRIAEQRYATGEATQSDVLRAQVELTHLINRLETERLVIESDRAELNALLSRGPEDPLGRPEDPAPPQLHDQAGALAELALEKRPDIAAQAEAIAREETAVQLARRNYLPDFELSVGRFVNYGQNDGFGAMASVTLPFVNGAKYDAGVAEASARLAAERAERRRLEDRVRRQVEQAYLRARTGVLQYRLFADTHIPQAEQALRVTESGYESGTVGFLDLVDTLRRLELVHLDHVAAQAEFEKAWAELERAVGCELPRTGASPADEARHG